MSQATTPAKSVESRAAAESHYRRAIELEPARWQYVRSHRRLRKRSRGVGAWFCLGGRRGGRSRAGLNCTAGTAWACGARASPQNLPTVGRYYRDLAGLMESKDMDSAEEAYVCARKILVREPVKCRVFPCVSKSHTCNPMSPAPNPLFLKEPHPHVCWRPPVAPRYTQCVALLGQANDPDDDDAVADTFVAFGSFLEHGRKDLARSEGMYRRALEIDSTHADAR